jgi:hypothetical protein
MHVGGREQEQERQARAATEQGVNPVATQERARMVMGSMPDCRVWVAASPGKERRTIDDDIAPADETGMARELLAEVFGAPLSLGPLVRLVQQAGAQLHAVEGQIKRRRRRAAVLPHDETGLRVVGAAGAGLQWTHVTSTPQLPHYALHPQRGAQALDAIGILPRFRGVSLHDGWTA